MRLFLLSRSKGLLVEIILIQRLLWAIITVNYYDFLVSCKTVIGGVDYIFCLCSPMDLIIACLCLIVLNVHLAHI